MSFFRQIRTILQKSNEDVAKPKVETENLPEVPAAPVERRSRKRTNTHKGRRILIIDDSPTIVAALRKMLRSADCITYEAGDAETGLQLLRTERPDFIFLDIVLPGMNGFAALRLMRRDNLTHNTPVIMMSGNEQATEQFYAKRIGADDFMKKPFSRNEVFARIENLIAANKLRQMLADESRPFLTANPAPSAPQTPQAKPSTTPAVPAPTLNPAYTTVMTPPAAKPHAAPHPMPHAPAPVAQAQPARSPAPQATPHQPQPVPAAATASTTSVAALEARKYLTSMGLQYYNQAQFNAAIERGDKLAVELFIAGGGVNVNL